MHWRFWRKDWSLREAFRTKRQTEEELRRAAEAPGAKRDRQPRTHEQAQRDPEVNPAKPSDN